MNEYHSAYSTERRKRKRKVVYIIYLLDVFPICRECMMFVCLYSVELCFVWYYRRSFSLHRTWRSMRIRNYIENILPTTQTHSHTHMHSWHSLLKQWTSIRGATNFILDLWMAGDWTNDAEVNVVASCVKCFSPFLHSFWNSRYTNSYWTAKGRRIFYS